MSKKYKFKDNDKLYFVTFTVTNWIDLFIRNEYQDIVLTSLQFCQQHKQLEIYGWCIMTSHLHLIIGSQGKSLSDIMRDVKRYTAEALHQSIIKHPQESRREWLYSSAIDYYDGGKGLLDIIQLEPLVLAQIR